MGCTLGREPRPVEISAGDLDVAVLGQLSAANLAFRDEFEPGPINVIGFDAALRRRAVPKQVLEHAPRDGHGAVILADADAELDGGPFGAQARRQREAVGRDRLGQQFDQRGPAQRRQFRGHRFPDFAAQRVRVGSGGLVDYHSVEIATLDQLPTTSLPLRDEIEPGPIEMVGPRCVPAAVSPRVNAGTCAAARAQHHHVQQRRCPTRRRTAPRSTGRRARRVQQNASVPLTSCS